MAQYKTRLIVFIVSAIVLAGIVFSGILVIVYGLAYQNYQKDLNDIKNKITEIKAELEQGNGDPDSSLNNECDFYLCVTDKISSLPGSLKKLNDRYPLLLIGKSTQAEFGIDELLGKAETVSKQIRDIRTCIDEDRSISGSLSDLLKGASGKDLAVEYKGLATRNHKLEETLAAFSFHGSIKEKLVEFSKLVLKRSTALDFFLEDASVHDACIAIAADRMTPPAALIGKFRELKTRNDALASLATSLDLEGIVPEGRDMGTAIGDRHTVIQANIGYLAGIIQIQSGLEEICSGLSGQNALDGKFSQNVSLFVSSIEGLKDLGKQLDDMNGKQEYDMIAHKRTLESLGLTEKAKALMGYEISLKNMDSALADSMLIEDEIDKLLVDTKTSLGRKKTTLKALAARNQSILSLLPADVPPELSEGLARFAAACRERAIFIKEFIGYIDDKMDANSYHKQMEYYQQQADKCLKRILELSEEDPEHPELDLLGKMAEANSRAASEYEIKYNTSMSRANAHKRAYEASRKKYLALLDL